MCQSLGTNTTEQVGHDFATLGLDYVDLLLIHWPCDTVEDTLKTYRALEPLVASGKARAIGFSNFNADMVEKMMQRGLKVKPAVNQCAFSVGGHLRNRPGAEEWGRDDATVAMCKKHGITYEAYSPLGGWALGGTGRILKNPTVNAIAKAHNKSAAQVALRWVVQQDIVAVTSSNEKKYDESDLALWDFSLTNDEMAALAALK